MVLMAEYMDRKAEPGGRDSSWKRRLSCSASIWSLCSPTEAFKNEDVQVHKIKLKEQRSAYNISGTVKESFTAG